MSKYRLGDPSFAAVLRLKIASFVMVWAGRIAAKAQVSYRDAYLRRYGRPSLGQVLDEVEKSKHNGNV